MSDLIQYRRDIDGLRAIAVIAVLLFHLEPKWLPGGYLGVDVFFVISGFLITKIIVRELENDSFSIIGFYQRRIRRILPVLCVVLFVTSIFATLIYFPEELRNYGQSLIFAALQISNIYFQQARDYFDDALSSEALLHTWSLGVEEQFYLFWPWILLFAFRYCRSKLALIIALIMFASIVFSEYTARYHSLLSFYSLPSRMYELAMGGSLVFLQNTRIASKVVLNVLGILALTVLIFCLFYYSSSIIFPGIAAIVPCLATVVLLYVGQSNQSITYRVLALRPLVFIGLISYSLYLWHWPIIVFFKAYTETYQLSLTQAASIALVTVLLAYLSYRFVEQPFRKAPIINNKPATAASRSC